MRKIFERVNGFVLLLLVLLPEIVLASGPKAAAVVIVADTRRVTGILKWWGNLYNESHLYFALLTIVLIPVIGLLFGIIADLVMRTIGIDLESRDLAEH